MKPMKYIAILATALILILVCNRNPEQKPQSHSHEPGDTSHTHETVDAVHDHDEGEPALSHNEDDSTHSHEQGETVHTIELEDVLQTSEKENVSHSHEGEAAHTHEQEDAVASHTSESEELIPVQGEWEKLVGLETVEVKRMNLDQIISVPGQIVPDQNEEAIVSPFLEASINCVFVNIGDRVKTGDELACLTSPQIGILRAEYDKAKAELEIRQQNYERRRKLFEENIISEKAFQEAELEKKVAEVHYSYSMKKLLAIGITEDELDNPPTGHSDAVGSTIHMYAPISGIITSRKASIGQKVDPTHQLFQIVNIQKVWCEADIFDKDLAKVKIGQRVKMTVSAYPEETFVGKIFFIGSTLDARTKTVKILIEISNRSEQLKPGMFADTHIILGEKFGTLVVPKEAIIEDENLKIVFVKEGADYHRHAVQTGIVSDVYVEILSGVAPGDVVVTKGNYQLKSKLKMSTIDPHAGHVH